MHELRKDPLLSRWVAVLEGSKGPENYEALRKRIEESRACPLCKGNEVETAPEVAAFRPEGSGADTPGWSVRAVRSAAPVLEDDGDLGRKGVGMYDKMNSFGVHEIIVESPEHGTPPEDMGEEQMKRVIRMQVMRISEIEKNEKIKYVLVSKNSGMLAGSANPHPHSLIVAMPIIPMRIKAELDGAKEYYAYKERCIFCDIIDEEIRAEKRVIMLSERFIAFCPYASKFPFEFWIMPRRHNCSFRGISAEEVEDLGSLMTSLFRKMRSVLGDPSYSYVVHTAPNMIPRKNLWHTLGEDFHWHIEVVPRLLRSSGFEWGSGFYVITTSPEEAARFIREA
jgi:UDPglucose--hexose-1-phosphate uridylyltransferase